MNIKLIILLSVIGICFFNCSEPDRGEPLLTPTAEFPAFKRCHLSKEYINGKLYREVIYKEESNYEIEKINYFNSSGDILVNLTESYSYENGKVVEITSNYSTQTFKYNDKNDIIEDRYCMDNICTNYTYTYNYKPHTRPISFIYQSGNNAPITVYLEYQNSNMMSYFAYTLSNDGQTIYPEFSNQKFQATPYIYPYYEINPNPFNLYQSRLHEDYVVNRITHYSILEAQGKFPLVVDVSTYRIPDFALLETNTYSYEYTGCD